MKMLTKAIRKKLPGLYVQEEEGMNAIVHVKFFTPWTYWTWYATEGSPVYDDDGTEIDFRFFGMVHGHEKEMGYFMLSEMESIRGPHGLKIERDLHFTPQPVKSFA